MCRWTAVVVYLKKVKTSVTCSCAYGLTQGVAFVSMTSELVSLTRSWRHKLLYGTVSQLAALYIDCVVVLNIFVAILLPGGLFCTVNDRMTENKYTPHTPHMMSESFFFFLPSLLLGWFDRVEESHS